MFALACVLAAGPADPAVDAIVTTTLAAWKTPGLVVVVVQDGRPVVLQGYGVRAAGRPDPVTPDTQFPLGSCTKAFTSAAIAQLVDAGKMAFDEPARTHLPGFHLFDPAADAAVTVRDLLTHRTGVDGHDLLWFRAPWPLAEAVARLAKVPPAGPFRASYHYSSLQYVAAGTAAGNAAGKPWAALVRDGLTVPLGMTATAFVTPPPDPAADRAAGHELNAAGGLVPMAGVAAAEPNPAGSMVTTGRDLVPWLRFQLADGQLDGRRLVSAKTLLATRTGQTPMPLSDPGIGPVYPDSTRVAYAMGWVAYDHRGLKVTAHGGVSDGFRAQITLVPELGLGIALLNNLHQTKMNVALTNRLLDHHANLPPRDWDGYFLALEAAARTARVARLAPVPNAARPTQPLPAFAGTYTDAAYGPAKVGVAGGTLTFTWAGLAGPLAPVTGDTFRFTTGPVEGEPVTFTPTGLEALGRVWRRE